MCTTPLYMIRMFNVMCFTPHWTVKGLAKLINPLVDALNNRIRLPKFILMVPDRDFIINMITPKHSNSLIIGATLHYIIKEFDKIIDRRLTEIEEFKPGVGFLKEDLPNVIWVRMLRRPSSHDSDAQKIALLRSKFNSILEERPLDGKDERHQIMSITIPEGEF